VRRVEYYLGDRRIFTANTPPFDLQVILQDPGLRNGFTTLKAVAYDDIDNSNSASVEVTLQLPQAPASLEWELPAPDSRLKSGSFPATVRARLVGGSAVTNVSFLYRSSDGQEILINSLRPNNETVGVFWTTAPPPGQYELLAEITNADGFSYRSGPLPVVVE